MENALLQQFARQTDLMNLIFQHLQSNSTRPEGTAVNTPFDIRANGINEFTYRPEEGCTFDAWYARYEDLFELDAAKMDDAAKARVLVRKLDTPAYTRFSNFILPRVPNELTFAETVKELRNVFGRNISIFNSRFNCLQTRKLTSEDLVTYAGRVNRACENFQLSKLQVEQFKSLIFVCGLDSSVDADVRSQLMVSLEKDPDVTIKTLTDQATRIYSVKNDLSLVGGNKGDTHTVAKVTQNHSVKPNKEPKPNNSKQSSSNVAPKYPCWLCGGSHFVRFCDFKSHTCKRCGTIGHKDGFCDSASAKRDDKQRTSEKNRPQQRQHHKQQTSKSQQIFHVTKVNAAARRKFINLSINGNSTKLQIDCGSDITIISQSTWKSVGSPPTHSTIHAARNASGTAIKLLAELQCIVEINKVQKLCRCFISDIADLDVIGIEWFELFGLWDVPLNSLCQQISHKQPQQQPALPQDALSDVLRLFPDIFADGLGTCTKTEATLYLKPDTRPVYRLKRPVPYAALPAVEAELTRLEQSGVLSKVDFSDWAAPIVAVKKANGSLRICADFSTGLNDALETNRHPLPLPDDIFATLAGGTVFSSLDLSDAYLQITVHPDSRHLLTINTHRGLFRYNRLTFGIKAAPGIFQQTMDAMLASLNGVICYLDDIIVVGKTYEEHKQNLNAVLQRIQEWGFRLRASKCKFFMQELNYLGFIIDSNGRRPNPQKVEAITTMPAPNDVSTARSFIGMINYYGQFLHKFTELRAPLDKLLLKNSKFVWTPACQQAFEEIKALLQTDLLLTHFDPKHDILVASDASSHGLGAVILHRYPDGTQKAIAHASRTLSPAERNYGQIEKEALAIVFALKKFHKMLHGRRFHLSTDHKPLLAIFGSKKGIPVHTANRLQRWALHLMAYDFSIDHVASEKIGHADALSRLMSTVKANDEDWVIAAVQLEADVCQSITQATQHLPVTAEEIAKHTARDSTLQSVLSYTQNGWPTNISDTQLQKYHRRRDSISFAAGCLCYMDRVIIPLSLQHRVMKQLHQAHPGIVRMKALARSYVFWPDIDEHIETLVRGCQRCASAAKAPTKCLSSWPAPAKPWSRLHLDYAGPFQGQNYLIVVDALTKWPEIFLMSSTTAYATIIKLRELFARFGNPDCIVSDNGPQFASAEMKQFFEAEGILHIRSPPFHPQSNGQAERFVDTMKRALTKAEGEDSAQTVLQTFLKVYRSTPNASLPNNATPASLMLGRNIRTTLSLVKETKPEMPTEDRHVKYQLGDQVYVYDYSTPNKRLWIEATIVKSLGAVTYNVRTKDNKIWKRHNNQIRKRFHQNEQLASTPYTDWFPTSTHSINTNSNTQFEQQDSIQGELPPLRVPAGRTQRNRRPPSRLIISHHNRGRY